MADLGNLQPGSDAEQTQGRVREVCEFLLGQNIIPVLIGGNHELALGQYLAYETAEKLVSVMNVDAFLDMETEIFNVGDYLRKLFGARLPAEFFDHSNKEFMAKREQACDSALEDLTKFMKQDGVRVGILDSTNSTRKRRTHIREVVKSLKCKVIILETVCDKEEVRIIC